MKIIILGAGRMGTSVAEHLAAERGNDVTVIDIDPVRLAKLEERVDLRGVTGDALSPAVLEEAGAADTELLIACTDQDAINLVACKIAHLRFGIPRRIARLHTGDLADSDDLLSPEGFAVDRVVRPETSVADYIAKLVAFPQAMQVRWFARGLVALASVRAMAGSPLAGRRIDEIGDLLPAVPLRVMALYRRYPTGPDRFLHCAGNTGIEAGDEVFFFVAKAHIAEALALFDAASAPVRRVMIAGGGRTGRQLAAQLLAMPGLLSVKLVDSDRARCEQLAVALPDELLVLHGEATDEELLEAENIDEVDLFCATGSDDEDNIMAGMLAKQLGARRVLALIHQRSYADLMHGTQIDIALSPAQAMLGELLAHVRRGDVDAVHSLRRGRAEALDMVVRGDDKCSRVVGRRVRDLALPPGVAVGLIVRGLGAEADAGSAEVLTAHGDTEVHSGDHVLLFVPQRRHMAQVEKLFRVSATFL